MPCSPHFPNPACWGQVNCVAPATAAGAMSVQVMERSAGRRRRGLEELGLVG